MLRRSRQRHNRGLGFPSRTSRLTRHNLARCRNGSIVHMQSAPCLPRLQVQGPPPEICHISRCTVATSSDHGCLSLVSRGERFPPRAPPELLLFTFSGSSPENGHRGPHSAIKELTEIVSLFGRNLGTVHDFGGASWSTPAVDSMPLMSLRLFSALFHSASLSPCLISWSHQHSGPSSGLKWGRPSLVKSVGACQSHAARCVQ